MINESFGKLIQGIVVKAYMFLPPQKPENSGNLENVLNMGGPRGGKKAFGTKDGVDPFGIVMSVRVLVPYDPEGGGGDDPKVAEKTGLKKDDLPTIPVLMALMFYIDGDVALTSEEPIPAPEPEPQAPMQ